MSQLCPKCSEPASCKDSRRDEDGVINRRFDCGNCGCRFYSKEVIYRIGKLDLTAPKNHVAELSQFFMDGLKSKGFKIIKMPEYDDGHLR